MVKWTRSVQGWLLAGALAATAMSQAGLARACATCSCGDPTLTTMGVQQPFAGRLRLSLEGRHRTDAVGREGADRVELSEQRVAVGVSYAPVEWLTLSGSVPFLHRTVSDVSDGTGRLLAIGDAELRGRAVVYRSSDFAPRHLFSTVAGVRLPTGPIERDGSGDFREPEVQAGTGSFDPLLGLSYGFFADPWSAYLSYVIYLPTHSRGDWRIGPSVLGAHVVQYQFLPAWAARLGAYTRLDDKTRRDSPAGPLEPDTGGFVGYIAPAVVVSPLVDVVISLELSVPLLNWLVGRHDEGPVVTLGVAYDV